MTILQRVSNILIALVMIMFCVLLIIIGKDGFHLIILVIAVSLTLAGLGKLRYYFTMARHMVGGKSALINAIITLDIGVFTLTMLDDPAMIMISYVIGGNALAGAIDILRARESRKFGSGSWKISMASGVINVLMALGALVFGILPGSLVMVVYIYCANLLVSAVFRIIKSFRKTAVVYIA